ncbi:MAG: UvrB/UvrC motif-containing protein [Candidatus Auribacterota bacterium]|nr:UvrB/UvrC motif-containing protein [Candidatus Auribacterota bacterium]
MKCQNCKKEEATVHLTEITDGKAKELHLCKKCAEKKGISLTPPDAFSALISSLTSDQISPEEDNRTCPGCGLTFKELRQGGRLGCGECYSTFKYSLTALISNIHKGTKHVGKTPAGMKNLEIKEEPAPEGPAIPETKTEKPGIDKKAKIAELKKKIKIAVSLEEYEKAAHLRDWIKDLEGDKKAEH